MPVPGGPISSTPFGTRAPMRENTAGCFRNSTSSCSSSAAPCVPGDIREARLRRARALTNSIADDALCAQPYVQHQQQSEHERHLQSGDRPCRGTAFQRADRQKETGTPVRSARVISAFDLVDRIRAEEVIARCERCSSNVRARQRRDRWDGCDVWSASTLSSCEYVSVGGGAFGCSGMGSSATASINAVVGDQQLPTGENRPAIGWPQPDESDATAPARLHAWDDRSSQDS